MYTLMIDMIIIHYLLIFICHGVKQWSLPNPWFLLIGCSFWFCLFVCFLSLFFNYCKQSEFFFLARNSTMLSSFKNVNYCKGVYYGQYYFKSIDKFSHNIILYKEYDNVMITKACCVISALIIC